MTDQLLSTMTVQAAVDRIGNHDHCQAGGAIGMSGALAAALAQATANATRVEQPDAAQDATAQAMQERMGHIRAGLLHLADQDANAILAFVAMEERGEALAGYALLCRGPQQMADLAIDAAQAMQAFRPHVCARSQDDLEFALTLMAGVARAALQLLDSNLRIWPLPDLLAEFEPHVSHLLGAIDALQPVPRIRG